MNFDHVYIDLYPVVFRFAFKLSQSESKGKDYTQEAFLKLYTEIKSGKDIKDVKSWLIRVIINQFKNDYKKDQQNYKFQNMSTGDQIFDPDKEAKKIEIEKIVLKQMNLMSENDRVLLMLYHEGYSYHEIAEITQMNEKSVGKTLSRSINRLKIILKEKYHELFI